MAIKQHPKRIWTANKRYEHEVVVAVGDLEIAIRHPDPERASDVAGVLDTLLGTGGLTADEACEIASAGEATAETKLTEPDPWDEDGDGDRY